MNLPAPPVARLSVCEVNERPAPLYCCLSPQLELSGSDSISNQCPLRDPPRSPLNSNTLLIGYEYILIPMARSSHNALPDPVELFSFVAQKVWRDASPHSHSLHSESVQNTRSCEETQELDYIDIFVLFF